MRRGAELGIYHRRVYPRADQGWQSQDTSVRRCRVTRDRRRARRVREAPGPRHKLTGSTTIGDRPGPGACRAGDDRARAGRAVLCRVVLCCVVLCCVALCCVVLSGNDWVASVSRWCVWRHPPCRLSPVRPPPPPMSNARDRPDFLRARAPCRVCASVPPVSHDL